MDGVEVGEGRGESEGVESGLRRLEEGSPEGEVSFLGLCLLEDLVREGWLGSPFNEGRVLVGAS
jgi:hypothetical protein